MSCCEYHGDGSSFKKKQWSITMEAFQGRLYMWCHWRPSISDFITIYHNGVLKNKTHGEVGSPFPQHGLVSYNTLWHKSGQSLGVQLKSTIIWFGIGCKPHMGSHSENQCTVRSLPAVILCWESTNLPNETFNNIAV